MDDTERHFTLGERPRLFESVAAELVAAYPESTVGRLRDAIEIHVRIFPADDEPIVVILTPESCEVRLPTIDWTGGSYGPVASSQRWKRVALSNAKSPARAVALLSKALTAKDKSRVCCLYCGRLFNEAHTTGDACHGCASRELGIVY